MASPDLYIDLMKRVLANTIYEDEDLNDRPFDAHTREYGFDHPKVAHTMIGTKRLDNIHFCLQQILQENIPGDCIETGVWRGGATILMRAILKAHNDTTRKVWVADSFAGVPPPKAEYPEDRDLDLFKFPHLAVSLKTVQNNFKKYDLLDGQVVFLKGFFCDTLPTAPIDKLALLRLDGDLYESTLEALTHLYPKLSVGGYVIIDDYGAIPACKKAVHDYRTAAHIDDEILWIDAYGIYWKKTKK
jgi:hypothetical protein